MYPLPWERSPPALGIHSVGAWFGGGSGPEVSRWWAGSGPLGPAPLLGRPYTSVIHLRFTSAHFCAIPRPPPGRTLAPPVSSVTLARAPPRRTARSNLTEIRVPSHLPCCELRLLLFSGSHQLSPSLYHLYRKKPSTDCQVSRACVTETARAGGHGTIADARLTWLAPGAAWREQAT